MKKIIGIFIVSLLSLTVLATVLTAVIKTTLPNPIKAGYETVEVWKNGTKIMEATKDEVLPNAPFQDELNKIDKLFKESLTDSVLSTLFQNNAFSYGLKVRDAENTAIANSVKDEGIWLVFIYSDAGTTSEKLQIDGKDYVDTTKAENVDRSVYYKKLIVKISDTSGYEDATVYLENTNRTVESGSLTSMYNIKFLARQENLFKYLNELDA